MQENKLINLFVDDIRECPAGFILARSYSRCPKEAIDIIESHDIHILSLDHDLGLDESGELDPTGYDIVKYICRVSKKINRIYLHTGNPVGRENMYQTLLGARERGFINSETEIYRYAH